MNTANLSSDFAEWLNTALSMRMPAEIRAFNFNLYEGVGRTWDIELIGTAAFDPTDPDWACDSIFSHAELFFISQESVGEQWEQALATAIELISTYLRGGRHRDALRNSLAVGVGFVNGDLTILWPETAA